MTPLGKYDAKPVPNLPDDSISAPCVPDPNLLARATARVVGQHEAFDYHYEWALKVVREYRRLAVEEATRP